MNQPEIEPWVDTHAHLSVAGSIVDDVEDARRRGVRVLAATSRPSEWRLLEAQLRDQPGVTVGLGMHPEIAGSVYEEIEWVIFAQNVSRCSWVSEVGVDGSFATVTGPAYGAVASLDAQVRMLGRILEVLEPRHRVSVHSHAAETEVLDLLETYGKGGVVLHNFQGSPAHAERAIALGCYFSVNAHTDAQIARSLRMDRILLETDAPYFEWNGRRVRSADIPQIAHRVSSLVGMPSDEFARRVRSNWDDFVGGVSI